jgi:general stress protein 26
MSGVQEERDTSELSRLLAGAANTIASVRFCWLLTAAEKGATNSRPMGPLRPELDEDAWKVLFLTDRRSHKASEIRRDPRVRVIFHHDPDNAFVSLIGTATLHEEEAEIRKRWKPAYDRISRSGANVAFIEVEVERMDLWIQGITPEPFGFRTTTLKRDAGGAWRRLAPPRDSSDQ